MFFKVITVLSLAACALGNGHAVSEQKIVRHHSHQGELAHIENKAPEHQVEYAPSYPSYEFSYSVNDPHTHDVKGQSENRHGDEVKGEYWLVEPDGRKRIVKYTSDKHSGFKATVEYSSPHHHIVKEHEPPKEVEEKQEPEPEVAKEVAEDNTPQHITLLTVNRPRFHKFEVDGYHPRNLRRTNFKAPIRVL